MSTNVTRRSARAVLIDGSDLLLIKRTRPGQAAYWVTIGGGVEPEDTTLEDAVRREVLEEIGAQIQHVAQILIIEDQSEDGIAVQHIFLAELAPVGLIDPTGEELSIPSRGGYELVRVPFTAAGIAGIDLKPAELADYLGSTCDALLASVGYPVMSSTTHTEQGGAGADERVREPERA